MGKEFKMSIMGDLIFLLGLQVMQKKNDIFICQSKYVKYLLKKYNMDQCKSTNTPMSATTSLDQDQMVRMLFKLPIEVWSVHYCI